MKKLIATLKNEDWVIVYAGAILLLIATLFPEAMPSMPKELGSAASWFKAATMFAGVLGLTYLCQAVLRRKIVGIFLSLLVIFLLSLAAQVEGELAGGIVGYLVADTVEIEYLSVQERFRGRGIARALLARVESQAQERGARKILLNTYGFQAPGLYRHIGFQEVAAIDDVLGTSWHIFLKRI